MERPTQKYVRLKQYDTIIIFSEVTNHSEFKHMNPVSAGFCYFSNNKVVCYGESVSLRLKSALEDSEIATTQIFGMETDISVQTEPLISAKCATC